MPPTAPSTAAIYRPLSADDNDPVSVILKLRGQTCDIDCLYCFEKRKDAPGGARLSADDAGRLTAMFGTRPVAVELHGGEPLTIGQTAFAAILEKLAQQHNVVRVSMQTNALLLDETWLDLIDRHYPTLEISPSAPYVCVNARTSPKPPIGQLAGPPATQSDYSPSSNPHPDPMISMQPCSLTSGAG